MIAGLQCQGRGFEPLICQRHWQQGKSGFDFGAGAQIRPLLKGGPTGVGGGVGLWPVGGWVSLVLGNLAQRAYSPPPGGGGSGWVGGWVGNWVGAG